MKGMETVISTNRVLLLITTNADAERRDHY